VPLQRSATALVCLLALGFGASAAYTVRPGDTLSGIASRLGVRAADLARANGISDPDQLIAGRALALPGAVAATAPGRTHRVASGENLTTIARRYGVTVQALTAANRLDARGVLREGASLVVPVAAAGGATAGFPARLQASPARLAYVPVFRRWATANAIPADLLMATTYLESGWQNTVVSSVGAMGIGQLMPGTVRFVRSELIGVPTLDPGVPEDNIRMSARYLRFLLAKTRGDVRLTLAGYYQGLGSVQRSGMYASTVLYVDGVQSLRPRFRL
jgi:LysM repeat protein